MDIYSLLDSHGIVYERFDHEAVFTVEEAYKIPEMPGAGTKNLFLRDVKGLRHFLVVVSHEKRVNLKTLEEVLGVSKLSFASPERLKKYLDVEPGSVTLLGLVNDTDHAVEVLIDEDLWGKPLQCHPLVNTATLVIPHEDVQRFLVLAANPFSYTRLPS